MSETALSHAGYTDGPRANTPMPRFVDNADFSPGRGQLLGSFGSGAVGQRFASVFTLAEGPGVSVGAGAEPAAVVELNGEGYDRVLSDVNYMLAAGVSVEMMATLSTSGTTTTHLTGNEFGQRMEGNRGANTLDGLAGADQLYGYAGADTLNGGDDADSAYGGDGNDTLIGGLGDDTMAGGAGSDQFWFNAGLFGADTITDFANGSDQIRISGIAGVDDFSDLAISANGSGWAVFTLPDGSTITLTGMTTGQVDASDFVFG